MSEPRGVFFPWQRYQGNFPYMVTGDDRIASSIRQVLLTELGERRMRPTFGSNLHSFLFENQDEVTILAVQSEVYRAIRDSGINVLVNSIEVAYANQDSPTRQPEMDITITYENLGRKNTLNVTLD